MENRAVEPDDTLRVVVFDLGRLRHIQMVMMRREVAVRDRVIVAAPRLMHVLRCER